MRIIPRSRLSTNLVKEPAQAKAALPVPDTASLVHRMKRFHWLNPRYRRLSDQLITDPTYNQYSKAHQHMQKSISRTTTAFGLALVGQFVFPPFLLLSTGLLLYGFSVIPLRALKKLQKGIVDVDMISSVTVLTGILSGNVLITAFVAMIFFRALRVTLRVKGETQSLLINVFRQQPGFVWVVEDGSEIEIPFHTLRQDDIVVVTAGNIIPVDGTVLEGFGLVDQHALTGEAQPVERSIAEPVLASTVLLTGKLYIRVERAGEDTKVAQIGNILNASIKKKSEVMLKSEEISNRSVPPTLLAATAIFPFVGLTGSFALLTSHFRKRPSLFASVLLLNYFTILSDKRILVKDGRALDVLADVDTLVFDKTGTLTTTRPHLHAIYTCSTYSEDEVLRLAAAAEDRQTHPIALAIQEAALARSLELPEVDGVEYELGLGLNVMIGGHQLRVGSHRFIEREDISVPPDIAAAESLAYDEGHTMIMVAVDDELIGALELMPTLRPEVRGIIAELNQLGIKETIIISGDHERPTRKLAALLGVDAYYAETLPQQKAAIIEDLIKEGRGVCYVGDGINDAIALQTAQVSVSMSGASTVATDAAQVVLLDGDLAQLPTFFAYGLEYDLKARQLVYGVVGLGVIGMGTAILPGALTYSVIATLGSLTGGLAASVEPLARYRWQKMQSQDAHIQDAHIIEGTVQQVEPQLNAEVPDQS